MITELIDKAKELKEAILSQKSIKWIVPLIIIGAGIHVVVKGESASELQCASRSTENETSDVFKKVLNEECLFVITHQPTTSRHDELYENAVSNIDLAAASSLLISDV